ncbi:HAD family hydrolase [Agarilytica rhodophyticola]|uniref:histidinol-phosphatase n=1 Tax=Agarilytica rhodophyticola TaxID=1737490 RepID=UPI000B349B25|nr:HAD family hydrolase [Agarilytica rhodophyticola]
MSLAIFDLDNTLLGGDSDHSWGEFMIEKGLVDGESHKTANDQFYQDYKAGTLDISAYVSFTLSPLRTMSIAEREKLHEEFMASKITPLILPKAQALIEKHRNQGHTLLIITATNHFITAPIARRLGIENLLATDPEVVDGKFTGRLAGTPCFQEGKVVRLRQWLQDRPEDMEESFFYSDSFNDLPLLEQVSYPYAVDPDETLKEHAENNNWPVISLR